jgi:hypothetical protein
MYLPFRRNLEIEGASVLLRWSQGRQAALQEKMQLSRKQALRKLLGLAQIAVN